MDITKETAERILYLIRLGHPDEHNEPYSRFDVIDEIKRRGIAILKELGWTTTFTSIYKNRYTASETTLMQELKQYNDDKVSMDNLFGILEHYYPIELWVDDDVSDEYNPKGKLDGWFK